MAKCVTLRWNLGCSNTCFFSIKVKYKEIFNRHSDTKHQYQSALMWNFWSERCLPPPPLQFPLHQGDEKHLTCSATKPGAGFLTTHSLQQVMNSHLASRLCQKLSSGSGSQSCTPQKEIFLTYLYLGISENKNLLITSFGIVQILPKTRSFVTCTN